MNEKLIQEVVEQVLQKLQLQPSSNEIPIAVSARHVHLSEQHVADLFGKGYQLTAKSPLSQPGQFAAHEQVTVVGAKSALYNVRVLGPARELTQVEISATDARQLGISAPLRFSGDIAGSAPITLVGPNGSVYLQEGCIIAAAHIHMSPQNAQAFQVQDGELVNVQAKTERPIIFNNVKVRVSDRFELEMHVDTDEGNAAMIIKQTVGEIIRGSTPNSAPAVLIPQASALQLYNKKLLSETDVQNWQQGDILIPKKTIVTALALDQAKRRGIRIIRQ